MAKLRREFLKCAGVGIGAAATPDDPQAFHKYNEKERASVVQLKNRRFPKLQFQLPPAVLHRQLGG